ncbi:unnamed protein product [Lampetra planeri]
MCAARADARPSNPRQVPRAAATGSVRRCPQQLVRRCPQQLVRRAGTEAPAVALRNRDRSSGRVPRNGLYGHVAPVNCPFIREPPGASCVEAWAKCPLSYGDRRRDGDINFASGTCACVVHRGDPGEGGGGGGGGGGLLAAL